MSTFFVCPSEPNPVVVSETDGTFTVNCTEVFYSIEGGDAITDLTQILAAVADFDVVQITKFIAIYMVFFAIGVSSGLVMRTMRRA